MLRISIAIGFGVAALVGLAGVATLQAQTSEVERGKYLVVLAGCTDCHTPGYFFGKPDQARYLGGSDVGFQIPGLGVFHGSNLTSDKETGLGSWTKEQIIAAMQTGKRPDGRELAPVMPWRAFASLTKSDADAIVTYLMSLPPVKNKVPGPFGPNEKPTGFVMQIVPGEGMKK
jgi:mono/diheme cytochrome c family protein